MERKYLKVDEFDLETLKHIFDANFFSLGLNGYDFIYTKLSTIVDSLRCLKLIASNENIFLYKALSYQYEIGNMESKRGEKIDELLKVNYEEDRNTITTKVTGKSQIYFINKFIGMKESGENV